MFDLSQSVPVFPFLPHSPWVMIPLCWSSTRLCTAPPQGLWKCLHLDSGPASRPMPKTSCGSITLPTISLMRPASRSLHPCVSVSRKDCSSCLKDGPDPTGKDLKKTKQKKTHSKSLSVCIRALERGRSLQCRMIRAIIDKYTGHVRESPNSACREDDQRILQRWIWGRHK